MVQYIQYYYFNTTMYTMYTVLRPGILYERRVRGTRGLRDKFADPVFDPVSNRITSSGTVCPFCLPLVSAQNPQAAAVMDPVIDKHVPYYSFRRRDLIIEIEPTDHNNTIYTHGIRFLPVARTPASIHAFCSLLMSRALQLYIDTRTKPVGSPAKR